MVAATLLVLLSYQERVLSQWQVTDNPVPNIVGKFFPSGPEPYRGHLAVVKVLVNAEKSSSLEILVSFFESEVLTETTAASKRFERKEIYDPPFAYRLSIPWSEVEKNVVFFNKYGQELDLEKVRKALKKPTHVFMDNHARGPLVTPFFMSVYRDEQMWMSFSFELWQKYKSPAKKN